MENFERQGRQEQQGIEPGTSRLPVLNAKPLCHLWRLVSEANFFFVLLRQV